LGGIGLHKFYLGKLEAGLIMLVVSTCTCGIGFLIMHPIAIVEGVIYLVLSDAEFNTRYVVGGREWF
jgi:TM2 domain-containing membrane protein YozV